MKVFRQPATTRASHWLIAVAFFGLATTGAMLYFHVRLPFLNPRNIHLVMAIGMLVAAAAYYVQAVMNGTIARLLLRTRDLRNVVPMAQYYLGWRASPPAYDGYNPLQRAAYTGLLFVLLPLLAMSGLALWPHAAFAHALATLFGGRSAKVWHVVFAVSLLAFVTGHTFMVIATGFVNNVRSMITGWYEEKAEVLS
ncbi:MAG: cytochrome b/b6 domain-containing protein [Candidatus Eremiobacteraeota bacterium]|nr:cytochrome b/b6 domain-containing protein [Candidatus Eremiobacteraeota bacterium]